MPKRNREQQNKHNETRRNFVKEGKKAIFCLQHIKSKNPDIAKEACEIYDYLIQLYPNKRKLMKTEVYQRGLMNKPTTKNELMVSNQSKEIEPLLTIPLLKAPLRIEDIIPQTSTINEQQTDELIQQSTDLIRELQQDPDLKCFFTDEPANHVTLSSLEGTKPMTIDEEIDEIIRAEFDLLGSDLPEIIFEDDELAQLACM